VTDQLDGLEHMEQILLALVRRASLLDAQHQAGLNPI
jgi:hypothetical protein